MIIDTSAVLAILLAEEDAGRYAAAIEGETGPRMSAVNFLEAAVVIDTPRRETHLVASKRAAMLARLLD